MREKHSFSSNSHLTFNEENALPYSCYQPARIINHTIFSSPHAAIPTSIKTMSPLDNFFYDFLDCRWNATQILSTCINRNISSLSTSCALHDLDEQSKRLVRVGFEDQRRFFVFLTKQERARSFFVFPNKKEGEWSRETPTRDTTSHHENDHYYLE